MGLQPIHSTSTTQMHPLGMVVSAKDINYGEGEFIYLKGVASTEQGDLCAYDSKAATTVRSLIGGSGSSGPMGVAASANVASQYGWYQVSGATPVKAATASANTPAYMSATAGQVDDAISGGNLIDGLFIKAATSAGYATCQLERPSTSGDIDSGTNTGDVTLGAIGSTPNANGMTRAAQVINLEPADASFGGIVTTGTQTIAGAKTFTGTTVVSGILEAGSIFHVSGSRPTSAGSGTGITVAQNGRGTRGVMALTVAKEAFTAAAVTQDLTLWTLAAKQKIVAFYADLTAVFALGASALSLTVGTSAGGNQIIASFDMDAATVTKGLADADMGTSMTRAAAIQGGYLPSWTGATTVSCRLTSDTDNLGNATITSLTTGAITFYMILENL